MLIEETHFFGGWGGRKMACTSSTLEQLHCGHQCYVKPPVHSYMVPLSKSSLKTFVILEASVYDAQF